MSSRFNWWNPTCGTRKKRATNPARAVAVALDGHNEESDWPK
ncbi:MAG: hypothetical protein M5U01_31150 [Ardenticatenaceae bacterium]|nr:hypothetical protein [Ardenticatenaceae bacterium]